MIHRYRIGVSFTLPHVPLGVYSRQSPWPQNYCSGGADFMGRFSPSRLRILAITFLFTLSLIASTAQAAGLTWEWRNPLPQGNALYGVVYAGGRYVAVGGGGTVMVSRDGLVWDQPASGVSSMLRGVAFGNGRYVAVGAAGVAISSEDGEHWQTAATGVAQDLTAVAFGAGTFVAVGLNSAVATSADGVTWAPAAIDAGGRAVSYTVVGYGNGQFVAMGLTGVLQTSADGRSWVQRTSGLEDLRVFTVPRGISYGNGRFAIAVEANGRNLMLTSANGVDWSYAQTSRHGGVQGGVLFAQDRFLAYETVRSGYTSADGQVWKDFSQPETFIENLNSVAYGNGQYVGVGRHLWTSEDGVAWTRQSKQVLQRAPKGLIVNETGFVGVGGFDRLSRFTSPDGVTWDEQVLSVGAKKAVAYGNSLYVAVGGQYKDPDGPVVFSRDTQSWTAAMRNQTIEFNAVAFGAGVFVAVGDDWDQGGGAIFSSSDGQTWVERARPRAVLNKVAYGGGQFVAAGWNGTILTSADGATWVELPKPVNNKLNSVAYGGGQYVIAGSGGTIVSSADARTWTKRESGTQAILNDVQYGSGMFLAVGDSGTVLSSTDGSTWVPSPSGLSASIASVAYGQCQFLIQPAGSLMAAQALVDGAGTAPDPRISNIRVSRDRLPADGKAAATVTVTLVDAQCRPVPEKTVSLRNSGKDAVRPVSPVTNSAGKAVFSVSSTEMRTVTLEAVADGVALKGQAAVEFVAPPCGAVFGDVTQKHPGCRAIENLVGRKVLSGYQDSTFRPERPVTRGEFAKMLVVAMGRAPQPDAAVAFADSKDHWAARLGYVQAAVQLGAISGFTDGTFRPDEPMTRAQLVKITVAVNGGHPGGAPSYTDVPSTQWYAGWVAAAEAGRLIGAGAGTPVFTGSSLEGDRPATRAEAAMVLTNLLAVRT